MRLILAALAAALALPAFAQEIRFATYNASLNRGADGELAMALSAGDDEQALAIAAILARIDADVILINEFDYAPDNGALFRDNYLADLGYEHLFIAPSNTGIASGLDLNGDGAAVTEPGSFDYAADAFGFGTFPGQYGMLVLSRFPIDTAAVRTFQTFVWADMPGARLPELEGESYYSAEVLEVFRLSSKSHWDIPILVGDARIHFLVSHPTPPVFDGPEDRNGTRNADEIRFWADYITGAEYIYDDAGVTGGLPRGAHFVIAGDLNSDPFDGDSLPGAAQQLLDLPEVNVAMTPASDGGWEALDQGGPNESHIGSPDEDTADFGEENGPGNLRVDYVLPSQGLDIIAAEVFWPTDGPGVTLIEASDHRPVWIDVVILD